MATYVLEILDGDRAGDVLPVTDRTLRIGRKPGNDLVLADEKTSGVHAEVVLEGDRHVLRDLGSTNGTFLDGKRVTEIVLSPGDVVTIGRLRVKFRLEGEAGAPDAGELAVRRLDAARLQRRGSSLGLVGLVALLVVGAAGYVWWQQQAGPEDAGANTKIKDPLVVAGNRLPPAVAACDVEEGWNLRAAGAGFQPTGNANTGTGSFQAVRSEGADVPDFAVLRLAQPIPVFAGRTMTLVGHLRTEGAAQMALRAVCFPSGEQSPFRFCTGSPFAAHAGWQRVETVLAIPPGCDRMFVEVVAAIGDSEALALIDDVAVVEAGQATASDQKLAESSQTLLGTGASYAVRSTDPENPATLMDVLPATVPAPFEGLHRQGLCTLSDLGASLVATATERSFQFVATGVDALQFVFTADAAAGLLAAGADDGFASAAAESEFTTRRLVLGDRATRLMLQFDAPVACRGSLGGGLYRMYVQTARAELVLGFRAERQQAGELLRQARTRLQEGQPGNALDVLQQVTRTVPLDSEMLAQAQMLRAEILTAQADAIRSLQQDLDESLFFDTRGGFERVVLGIDEVVALYGEANLEDAESARSLRERASQRLQEIDGARQGAEKQRLEALAKAFGAAQQPGLAKVVEAYVARHLAADTTAPKEATPAVPAARKQ